MIKNFNIIKKIKNIYFTIYIVKQLQQLLELKLHRNSHLISSLLRPISSTNLNENLFQFILLCFDQIQCMLVPIGVATGKRAFLYQV